MISVDDNYKEVKECTYKGEHYSVRDNGAIMRHSRKDKRVRKNDDIWTFGKPNENKGYNYIGAEGVHRIVAYAFLGEPPTKQHVVDHIDTNRRNNRPENLRWVTKLENALNNPITRARIENICGSIEVFLKNPSILQGHEKIDSNFSWMRAVSPEEAKASLERFIQWSKTPTVTKGGRIDEWIYQKPATSDSKKVRFERMSELPMSNEYESLTSNVVQVNWKTPTAFPLCPQEPYEKPLVEYKKRLLSGKIFCSNQYHDSIVLDAALVDNDSVLFVMCKSNDKDATKPWSLAEIKYEEGKYYHNSIQTYFEESGAQKYFTIAKGEKWTGGDVPDDEC